MARPGRMQGNPAKAAPEIPTTLPADLPAPSTCRNLLPRSRTASLARSGSRSLPGSRGSSRHSSMSLANSASLAAPVESHPLRPSSAGGTISLESGQAIDSGERVSRSADASQSGQVKDSAASAQSAEFAPTAGEATGSTQSRGSAPMDFTQGNGNYGWPSHMDGNMPQLMGRPSAMIDEEAPPWWPPLFPESTMQNEDPWRSGGYNYQDAGGSSSTSYQTSGPMTMLYPGPAMGSMGSEVGQANMTSWSNPNYSWSDNQYASNQSLFASHGPWVPPHMPPAPAYNVNVGTSSAKRKRSPSGEREQGAAGTSNNSFTSPHNYAQYPSSGLYDSMEDDDEVAQALLTMPPGRGPQSQTRPGRKETIDRKGKGKARAQTPLEYSAPIHASSSSQPGSAKSHQNNTTGTSSSGSNLTKPKLRGDPLSAYTCPICFSPPTNATITPCGHICCGECLFAAVKTTLQRSGMMGMGMRGGPEARCPVCRAAIPGWDGKGGGVTGLKVRAVFSL